jgi:diacylglycerol kinase family enzyme
VYAVGGDGILFDCLNGVIGLPNAELAAIPYGRANNFIRGFGKKSIFLFRDLNRQFAAPSIPLDVIRSGNIYALSFCTVGVTSQTILYTQQAQSYLEAGGPLTQWLGRRLYRSLYFLAGIPAFCNRRILMQRYDIEIDGEQFNGPFRGMLMANGCYYGDDQCPVPAAMPNDGLLDVVLACGSGPLRFLSRLPAYMRGGQDKYPDDFIMRKAREINISSDEPILVNIDDVVYYETSCKIEVLVNAVRFVDASNYGYRGGGGGRR